MDVVRGNQTLFMRRDEVEAAWKWVDPIRDAWEENRAGGARLHRRHLGSVGLDRADRARRPHLARERLSWIETCPPWLARVRLARTNWPRRWPRRVADRLRGGDRDGGARRCSPSPAARPPALFFRALCERRARLGQGDRHAGRRALRAARSSRRSNAALVSENLLQDKAAAADFVRLYRPADERRTKPRRSGRRTT